MLSSRNRWTDGRGREWTVLAFSTGKTDRQGNEFWHCYADAHNSHGLILVRWHGLVPWAPGVEPPPWAVIDEAVRDLTATARAWPQEVAR
jgi:hypothetical protein